MLTLIYTLMISATLGGSALDAPKGWFKAGTAPDKYEMGIEKGAGPDGKDAATIYPKGKLLTHDFGTLMQTIAPDKYIGKRVRLTGYLKTKDADWAALWFRIDGHKEMLGFDNMSYRGYVKGTTDWKQYELVLDVPEGSTDINYGGMVGVKGQVWFDNLTLEIVDNNTPVTGNPEEYLSDSKPLNLDLSEMWREEKTGDPELDKDFPKGWFHSWPLDNFSIGVEKGGGKEKGNAIVIQSKGKARGTGSAYQTVRAEDFHNTRIRVTAWMKTKDVKKHAGLWITIAGKNHKRLAYDYMWDKKRNVTGTTEWTRYEIVLDVPKDAEYINYGLFIARQGQAWISDFTFEMVDASIPVTGKGPKVKYPESPEPVNLDFEN